MGQGNQHRKRRDVTSVVNLSFGPCPPGAFCGHGPVCTTGTCDLLGCEDAPACQYGPDNKKRSANKETLVARQVVGPPFACVGAFCSLEGCEDAPACQDNTDNKKRSAGGETLIARQFGCPPGLGNCGPGPVCAGELCSDPGCAGSSLCQDYNNQKDRKRSPATDIAHPICDICIIADNGQKVCGCATTVGGELRQRDAERACPLFCIETDDGDLLCGCAAEDYERSLHGGPTVA